MRDWLAGRVRATRLSRELTMEEAAAAAGVSHVTWRRIEQGQTLKSKSYAAADRFLGFPIGTSAFAVERGSLPPTEDPGLREIWDSNDIAEMQGDWDKDRFDQDVGRLVSEVRTTRKWTREEAAKRTGLSLDEYDKLENGYDLNDALLEKADEIFGISTGSTRVWEESGKSPRAMLAASRRAPTGVSVRTESGQLVPVNRENYRTLPVRLKIRFQEAATEADCQTLDSDNPDRALYEKFLAILNMLSFAQLSGARQALEKAESVRQFESKFLNVAQGTIGFAPEQESYDAVTEPWTELADGKWGLLFPAGMLPPEAVRALASLLVQEDQESGGQQEEQDE